MHQPRIEWVNHKVIDLLRRNLAVMRFREFRLRFEKAAHLRLRIEPSKRVAFKGFNNDGGDGFIADQNFAFALGLDVFVARKRAEYPIAVFDA
ncbi:MAG: hypothetical protein AAGF36_01555 [Pseudomonadota bacterium]